jgi:cytochrome c peroxidase
MRLLSAILAVVLFLYWGRCAAAGESSGTPFLNLDEEPVQPLIVTAKPDPKKVRLGGALFNDPKLSSDKSISCATCHVAEQGGAVHQQYSLPGVSGKTVNLNVPTILGSGLNFAQFWDGRADTLEDQIDGPLHGPDEMASDWPTVIERLRKDPHYAATFQELYGVSPNEKNVKDAIATFERAQQPVDAPFDRYLLGDKNAISALALKGYDTFKNLGCSSCHQGQNAGGNMFQKFGVIRDYFQDRGNVTENDFGRYGVTKKEEDKYFFKVPALRNVELTAPYFHDGSAKTLEQAVGIMAKYQLGRELSEQERAALVAFLKSLTGRIPVQP